jgi:hypothetical protein
VVLLVGLAACGGGRERPDPPSGNNNNNSGNNNNNNNNNTTNQRPCGNGVVNGLEACDGRDFANGGACGAFGLGDGVVQCTAQCTPSFVGCSLSDYCTANGLYGNGACDACEALGGVRDPDCETVCGADGTCGDRFEPLVGAWTCRRLGMIDPDCGTCGNGIIEGNELCDRQALPPDRFRCDDWGYLPGADIRCKNDCTPDFTACGYSVCGNSAREGAEVCDGADLGGMTCLDLGAAGGVLACDRTCALDTRGCIDPGCGNGILEASLGEECDGAGAVPSCESLGYAGGATACGGNCQVDTSGCVNPGCGNGIIESPLEECEGGNLNGQTCESLGFLQGSLSCSSSSCTFVTAQCVPRGCGNGIIEPGEDCEGADLRGASCQSLGFLQGSLTCSSSSCRYDTSACLAPGCGNGVIEAGEACDGANLQNQTCQSLGFTGGSLACSGGCLFSTGGCTGQRDTCGDGRATGVEVCDGTSFHPNFSNACGDIGFPGGGTASCNADCTYNFQPCELWTDVCSFYGFYNDGAVCDPCEFYTPVAHADDDCFKCRADGVCADQWSFGEYACVRDGSAHDPDCGCGNGVLEPRRSDGTIPEICDGSQFILNLGACTDWGFTGGVLSCSGACGLDFSNCF